MLVRYLPAIRLHMAPYALRRMTAHALSALHAPGKNLHKLLQLDVWQMPVPTVQF